MLSAKKTKFYKIVLEEEDSLSTSSIHFNYCLNVPAYEQTGNLYPNANSSSFGLDCSKGP